MRKKNENPKRNLSGFLITLFYVPSAIGVLTILIVGTVMHLGPVLSAVLLGLSCFSIEVYFPRLCIDGYEESLQDFFCRNLEFLYSRQAEIINNLFALCTENFSIPLEKLRESFAVTCIHMLKYEEYLLRRFPGNSARRLDHYRKGESRC